MNYIRAILAVISFALGCYFIYDLLSTGFNGYVFGSVFLCFILAHFLWPRNRNKNNDDWTIVFDFIEIIIEIPFKIISSILRAISRSSRDGDGIDFDI